MKNISNTFAIILSASAIVGLSSCSKADSALNGTAKEENGAIIVNNAEDALDGELIIKFRPELSNLLDQAGIGTKSGSADNKLRRLGIRNVDDLMDIIGGYEFERVFPVNPATEETTRKEGLHLWYIVRFDKNTDVQDAASKLSRLGELSKIQFQKTLKKVSHTGIKTTPFEPVKRAGVSGPYNDPGLDYQWNYINKGSIPDDVNIINMEAGDDINCAEAWQKCNGDPSVIVAIMDEGVMWSHPDLKANMWVNEDEIYRSSKDNDGNGYKGDVYGYNFAEDTGIISWSSTVDTGHGTHIAGTIAAVNNNELGVCGIAGGSGNGDGVRIMSIQIFSGDYGCTIANEVRAVKYAADNGATILQCSWGYNSALADPLYYSRGYATDEEYELYSPLEKEAFDYFIYHAGDPNGVMDGGLVVFASGNESAGIASYPGAYKDYLCVSSLAADCTPSTYSNYGPGVDISAPGGDTDYHCSEKGGILSTLTPQASGGKMYGYMEGTSMACPHVSAMAALGLSYARQQRKHFNSREYLDLMKKSVRSLDAKLTGNKLFHFNWANIGDACPDLIDMGKIYKGKMGSGAADIMAMFNNIDGISTTIRLPNVYVRLVTEEDDNADTSKYDSTVDIQLCFPEGTQLNVSVADPTIAETYFDSKGRLRIHGLKEGRTSLTVNDQTSTITVRALASQDGWL